MCYELVRAGKGRSAVAFDTPNHRTPVWLFRRVLRCDMSLQFPLSREGPLIVTAVVVAREVLAASTFYWLLPRSGGDDDLVVAIAGRVARNVPAEP